MEYYTPEGSFLGEWGKWMTPYPAFEGGDAISIAPNGNVYVLSAREYMVKYFTPNGSFLGQWSLKDSAPEGIALPIDLEYSSDGNVYVIVWSEDYYLDITESRVLVFSPEGTFRGMWGSDGSGEGEFDSISGIATDGRGIPYVADAWNDRVQYFTSTGSFLGAWGEEGSGPGQFLRPADIAVAPDGNVYVLDLLKGSIQYFRPVSDDD